jgi:hypothetical protein
MERNKEAKDFRMQDLFKPNPFKSVLKEFEKRYRLLPLPVDLLVDKRKRGTKGLRKGVKVIDL